MTVKYKTVITKAGAIKLAAATVPNGKKVNFTAMAVGDGGGTLPVPDPNQTKLVKEVWRHALNKISQDRKNKNYVVAELLIPPETGGFWMRELGLYDDTGTLIAVGNMAESYKPALAEGSGRAQTVRMVIMVSDIESVELTIDTSTVMATQDYVDDKLAEHEQSRRHPDATLTAKGFTQLSSATDSASESVAATPKAVKAAYDLAKGKYTAQDATTAQKGIVQLSSATDSTSESFAATPKAVKAAYDVAKGKYTAQDATTAQKGIVQLSSATDSTSEALAATPKAVKAANDNANGRVPSGRKVNGRALSSDINITAQDIFNGQTVGIGNAADLNAYTTPGLYYQPANAQAQTGRNYPEANAGSLEVYKHAGITQIYRIYNSSRSYIRTLYSGVWSAWVKQYDAANKPSPADINAVNKGGDAMTGGLKIRAADALRIYDAAYGMIFRRSENNFYLIPTAKDQGENGGISSLRPFYADLTNGRVTLGNGAVVNGGLGLGVVSGLGGNSIALGDNDTGFKQNGDGVLDVYANSKQVMRFLNSGITSYMLFNMNAGASVSSTLTFKNGSGITSEKTGANPRNGRIYWGGDASRGNRIEFADDAGWKAYIERHPSNGVQLVVNGRINGSIVYSSGEVLAGGGSARFAADGNIFGSKWGNQWLDAYLKNTYQPKGNYTPAGQAYTRAESDARYGVGKTTTGNNSAYYTHGNGAVFMQSVRNISVGNNATVTVTLPTSFPNGILGIGSSYNGPGGNNSASFYNCAPVGKNQVTISTHNCNGTFYLNVTGY
ncbi:phage tail protein [Enterobacter hormaechei subsp. steigerwaltii]|uniref:phage tail-collar fiber domain-containing protein n=1 Tax=Enterobacter hormaechei TaxID=158836 RepID=UPI00079458AB|nr:phage tail protein [Enterobacter hormaechei]EKS6544401.1 phage tail protein [Enterobacter hormaechei]KZP48755.1 phage tail protein [Enterobacter hormaechei subsp. steigerwaltii]KZQ86491.1 phage tail protein [Enterobacter hormaechei subsp. steigerwaltii]MCU3882458.1 phage tail protein [Enterobacter hormaechei subsp. steigerwaltii]NDU69545.1 phage tail protein [Enterobacter hormaechei]